MNTISSVSSNLVLPRRSGLAKKLASQRADAFIEFLLVTPILYIMFQGVSSLVMMLLVHQRASLVSRELGNYSYRQCSIAVQSDRPSCIAAARDKIYGYFRADLQLGGSESWDLPTFVPNFGSSISAQSNGIHSLLVQCKDFFCVEEPSKDACNVNSNKCSCTCGESALDPDAPANELIVIDAANPSRTFSLQDRTNLWREYKSLLLRNGQLVIATASGPYPTDRPLSFGKVVAHERSIF